MARNRRKKALYEVISQTRPKPAYGGAEERAPAEKTVEEQRPAAKPAGEVWPRRPRMVQLNVSRIEISLPYPIAIAVLLFIVLLLLVMYRFGQMSYWVEQGSQESGSETRTVSQKGGTEPRMVAEGAASGPVEGTGEVETKGSNRIVIQAYRLRTHLEPVKQYYESFGIQTEIKRMGEWYYLVTKDKYEKNPDSEGTEGYVAKKMIIELGAKYKAPPGYESFGPTPFHDAYGMKFDD